MQKQGVFADMSSYISVMSTRKLVACSLIIYNKSIFILVNLYEMAKIILCEFFPSFPDVGADEVL